MLRKAQEEGIQATEAKGFVHLATYSEESPPSDVHYLPLIFGQLKGKTVSYDDPACVTIGEVVVKCLDEQGIRSEWDRVPGHPVLVFAEKDLTGVPGLNSSKRNRQHLCCSCGIVNGSLDLKTRSS
jgi:hypothetical protein